LFELDKSTYEVEESKLPPAQMKRALIEDITGVRCQNCPEAAETAKEILDSNQGKVVVVGLYTGLFRNLSEPHDGEIDLRTQFASDIHSNYYNSPPLPAGGVNRKIYPGQSTISQLQSLWKSRVNSELLLKSPANMETSLSWLNDTTIDIHLDVLFNEDRTDEVFFSILLLENDLYSTQVGVGGAEIHNYKHKHVLRKMYTPYNGKPMVDEPHKGQGVVYDWRLYLPNNVNYDKSSIVILLNLNEENNKEVLQCLELKLK
jgi:hypothetical protein